MLADMYCGWSRKLKTQVSVYERERYLLWEYFEADPEIVNFNFRVNPHPVPTKDGGAVQCGPDGVTLARDGRVCLQVVHGLEDPAFKEEIAKIPLGTDRKDIPKSPRAQANWVKFSSDLGIDLRMWTRRQLLGVKAVRLATARLIRFCGTASYINDLALREWIGRTLISEHHLRIGEIAAMLPKRDPMEVMAEIAAMILDGEVFSDVHLVPLDLNLRVSARDIFPAQDEGKSND